MPTYEVYADVTALIDAEDAAQAEYFAVQDFRGIANSIEVYEVSEIEKVKA